MWWSFLFGEGKSVRPFSVPDVKRSGLLFRFKSGIKVSYDRQGYVYFISRLYKELPKKEQHIILDLCHKAGGEYYSALFDFVTTDTTAVAVCLKYHLSADTLYRRVRKYYEAFPLPLSANKSALSV